MSSTVIYGQEDRLLPWAEARIGCGPFRRDAYSMGLEKDGELVAVVVFDTFSKVDAHIHIASDGSGRWMNKELLLSTFAQAFVHWKLNRLTGVVPAKNEVALKFDQNLGFEIEGRCRRALPDDDVIILGLLRDRCRFITKEQRNA